MPEQELVQRGVLGKLARLRRALRARLLGEGVSWLLVTVVALVFATLAFDYVLRLERPLRAVLMSLAGAAVLVVLWRHVLSPMRVRMDTADLALLVERRHRELDDRLISALDFARMSDATARGMSEAMIRRSAEQANEMAGPLDFSNLVEKRGLRRVVLTALSCVMLLVGFAFWQKEIMRVWFERNVAFAHTDWPQDTYLSLAGGPDYEVLRGEDLEIVVHARGKRPPHVTIHVGRTEERIEPDPKNPDTYRKTFSNVVEPFEFYITGGDDRRDRRRPHRVTLIDPPSLRDVVFTVRYHPYANRAPEIYDGGLGGGVDAGMRKSLPGVLPVPVGATVHVEALADKDLSAAALALDDAQAAELKVLPEHAAGGSVPRRIRGNLPAPEENRLRVRTLRFVLTDTDGHTSRRAQQYVMQTQPDSTPAIDLKKRGVGSLIAPRAMIPVEMDVRDDYGLAEAWFEIRRGDGDWQRVDAGKTMTPTSDRPKLIRGARKVDLQPLGLEAGTTIQLRLVATDKLPPQYAEEGRQGLSGTISLEVVSEQKLLEELIRRQKELRLDFLQAIASETSAAGKSADAAEQLAAGKVGEVVAADLDDSATMQNSAAAISARVSRTYRDILEEMRNNRLGDASHYSRMSGIINALDALAEPMGEVSARLSQTAAAVRGAAASDAGALSARAREAAGRQLSIKTEMDEILKQMLQHEGRQDIANEMKKLVEMSRDLREQIKKLRDKRAGGIFDEPPESEEDDE